MPTRTQPTVTALILAGGRATRMGGVDKGLQECAGRPLIAHVLTAVAEQVSSVLISANRNPADYERFGHPVLTDLRADFPGPLAGIESGLHNCTTELLWIVPCDAPRLDAGLLHRLIQAYAEHRCSAVVPFDAKGMQPTFALLHKHSLAALRSYLDSGKRKTQDWLNSVGAQRVDCSDHPEWFMNINTPEDLAACALQLQA